MACAAEPVGRSEAGHCSTRAHAQQSCQTLIRAGGNKGVTSNFPQFQIEFALLRSLIMHMVLDCLIDAVVEYQLTLVQHGTSLAISA